MSNLTAKCTHEKVTNNTEVFAKGRFKIKDGDRLKIGLKKFDIDQFPSTDTLILDPDYIITTTLILDGVTYYKF